MVWTQHDTMNTTTVLNPQEKLLQDLTNFILLQEEKGFSVILGMDADIDIKSKQFQAFLKKTNLKNAIFQDTALSPLLLK